MAIIRLDSPDWQPGDTIEVECIDGIVRRAEICTLPMYDSKGEIVRGKCVDIPHRPVAV